MTNPKEALVTGRALPEGMSGPTWTRISALSDTPTVRHPLGLRTAVLERASLIYFGCPGTSWKEADAKALAEEAGIPTQATLGGIEFSDREVADATRKKEVTP